VKNNSESDILPKPFIVLGNTLLSGTKLTIKRKTSEMRVVR
jgi:hypothetical protein